MNSEQDAAISRYRKMLMLESLELSLSLMMASVELFRASRTELRQFCITKNTETLSSVT